MTTLDRLLRREEVQKRCGLARTTIYRKMREGTFPTPLQVGTRAVRWPESETTAWLESRPRATGDLHRG
jgi:prophage regulatory protein